MIEEKICRESQVSFDIIKQHHKALLRSMELAKDGIDWPVPFMINDTCRTDNEMVIQSIDISDAVPTASKGSQSGEGSEDPSSQNSYFRDELTASFSLGSHTDIPAAKIKSSPPSISIGAFVPAAGASSRYISPFADVIEQLEKGTDEQVHTAFWGLGKKNIDSWALPDSIRTLGTILDITTEQNRIQIRKNALKAIQLPKALYPCVREGHSYLEMKCIEHNNSKEIDSQIFICPHRMTEEFDKEIGRFSDSSQTKTICIEQGRLMSTIRFTESGEAVKLESGFYSVVPAGHGSLVRTFPAIKEQFPDLDAVFIRNVDNVNGTGSDAARTTENFLASYKKLTQYMMAIRQKLMTHDYKGAAAASLQIYTRIGSPDIPSQYQAYLRYIKNQTSLTLGKFSADTESILSLISTLFAGFHHSPPKTEAYESYLPELLNKYFLPFNLMGVVANNGTDIGGTPVVVRDEQLDTLGQNTVATKGQEDYIKVCVEMPHASKQDQERFFKDPKVATHFNPVYVCAELLTDISNYMLNDDQNSQFMLLTTKQWRGNKVRYFETVLYELLGNSKMANVIFLEVPRCIFNPHKSLDDTANRTIGDWVQAIDTKS